MAPIVVVLVVAICLGLFVLRRRLLALALGFAPPRYGVVVERGVKIPMPDGVELVADRYSPRNGGRFPTVLIRTPYDRRSLSLLVRFMAERGYHVVVQDVRGRFDSGGEFEPFVNEAADGRATVGWLEAQPWFDGSLATWGLSYLGYVQFAIAPDAPRSLKAIQPIFVGPETFSVTHQDGAFNLDLRLRALHATHFKSRFKALSGPQKLSALVSYFAGREADKVRKAVAHLPLIEADEIVLGQPARSYRDQITHTEPDDEYWGPRNHRRRVGRIEARALLVAGWFDVYLRGVLDTYAELEAAGKRPYLTIGAWDHAHVGAVMESLREGLRWFDAHLKGDAGKLRRRPVRLWLMGAGQWIELDRWPPPARATRFCLRHGAALSSEEPPAESEPDRYRYDPSDPTPAVGGASLDSANKCQRDNRELEARSDVLCYSTAPLADNLDLIGPVRLELYVSSSLAHTDFFGRLCDVDARGRSRNVCDGLVRVAPGRGERQPDGSLRLEVDLWATAYRFAKGHRLRLQVSSGAHPRWTRNLGTGEPIATGTRMEAADQVVFHDAAHPSALVVPVVVERR
ncbi:MAG: CocE/NonD family hydrolase [Planctomycetes bacterium]|nr:CocE/NonD family hydrolase [Planctomycetota bacterium]